MPLQSPYIALEQALIIEKGKKKDLTLGLFWEVPKTQDYHSSGKANHI
jgi:hypothetical protein